MFDPFLFLGLPKNDLLNKHLQSAHPPLVAYLTSGGDYLEEIVFNERLFLGKKSPLPLSIEELQLLEANVLSLLKKLAPQYPYKENPFLLLTVECK